MTTIAPPKTFRQSLLARHDKCPYSAMLYLKYDGGTESHYKTRGTVFHTFMQQATEQMLALEEPKMPGDVGRELADAIMAEDLSLVLSAQEQDVVRQCAWNWCEGTVLDLEALIGVELDVQLEIGGVTVTGRIDRAEAFGSSIHLHDAKTSLAVKKREEVQRSFQGQLYALMCLDGVLAETGLPIGAGINEVWFYEDYPRYRTEEGPIVSKEGCWTRPELAEFRVSLERNIAAFLRSLENDEWEARDGTWCATCPAQSECPIGERLREMPEVASEEQAQDAFSYKLWLERESRRIQSGLRGWVKDNGPVRQGDLVFDAQVTESKVIKDWDELTRALFQTTTLGTPFEVTDHVTVRTSTKFAKRKATEVELDEDPGR